MFLHAWHPQPILLAAGSVQIYWYGLCLAIGAVLGLIVIIRLGRRVNFEPNFLYDYFVAVVIGGFIGARLYHVLNEWGYYHNHITEIWRVWNGGLAIHGAMIAGLLILIYLARRGKKDPWLLADISVVGLVIGQAIGRWGNYFNQELFGRPTSLPWGIPIDVSHRPVAYINQVFFQPTFLYESLGCLIIFAVLFWLVNRRQRNPLPRGLKIFQSSGTIALSYFILYSILRVGMESLRIDTVPVILGLRLPLLTSLAVIVLAVITFLFRLRQTNPHGQKH